MRSNEKKLNGVHDVFIEAVVSNPVEHIIAIGKSMFTQIQASEDLGEAEKQHFDKLNIQFCCLCEIYQHSK